MLIIILNINEKDDSYSGTTTSMHIRLEYDIVDLIT